ncbi:putative sugar epimerase YhfK [Weizmannia acidilactici]|uniref:Sugar epimerase YhfK n=1 Tax=Weizmannia acidilactici TaxID=2607726 RepID=A0A5J4JJU0_9BACI|nr:SDR family oxidoreductase [Weizmannia acidilactici]GER66657.1 putative sugar epimerase YhfK [Weizmannia acidilactici]GER70657.1 putative sugar epimerase YhfK [Weizmannia acidilactici]GER72817.1 putative sugar epimerase YhfK [Weizmannia acidilactici]
MKVLVVGANGQIGKILVDLLQKSGKHTPRAMVRKEEQVEFFQQKGVETILADLEGTVDEIAEAATGCDAVVFTAGSGGHTGADKTLLVDLDGAVKTMEAAEQTGIDRFIIVSALQAHHRENWNEAIKPYYVAKHYADRVLQASKLDYTIIRPGGLLNEPGTGKVEASENLKRGTIPREDVARTILASLDEPNTYRKAFDLVSGDTPIEAELKSI